MQAEFLVTASLLVALFVEEEMLGTMSTSAATLFGWGVRSCPGLPFQAEAGDVATDRREKGMSNRDEHDPIVQLLALVFLV